MRTSLILLLVLVATGCGRTELDEPDAGKHARDAGPPDAGQPDAGQPDAGQPDAGQPDAGPCPPETWQPTGSLPWTTATSLGATLPNGKALVVGGDAKEDAALYDPDSGVFVPTGPMASNRANFTVTPLNDGRLLIAGGAGGIPIPPEELYDPATGRFVPTGSLPQQHLNHAAVRLADGRVLLAGGVGVGSRTLAEAVIWSPVTGLWTRTDPLPQPRESLSLTLLPDGTVLAAGGLYTDPGNYAAHGDAWRYDPATGHWSATAPLLHPRSHHTAVLLSTGKVLIAGGSGGLGSPPPIPQAELFDPQSRTFTETGPLKYSRYAHVSAVLPSGEVLLAGGWGQDGKGPPAEEIYSPATGLWRQVARVLQPRAYAASALLPNGGVLVAGGVPISAQSDFLRTAELFCPVTPP